MNIKDMHVLGFTEEECAKLNLAFTILNEVLESRLSAQTDKQNQRKSKIDDKTVAFVNKTMEHAEKNPKLIPAYFDLERFQKCFDGFNVLRNMISPLEEAVSVADDTMMQLGHEAYRFALAFYNSVKQAAKNNIPGAKVIEEDLSKRFDRKGKKAKGTTKTPKV